MTTKIPATLAAALFLFLAPGQTLAINMMAIGDLPIRYMTEEDRTLLADAARETLDKGADGQVRAWENTKTGARGELTPVATFQEAGRKCRDLEVANSAKGRSNRLVLTFCRQDDGDWKIEGR
jgi:surface antigen